MFESLLLDVRAGARLYVRSPGLVAAVALTLSVGVGVSSVLLTLFNGLFLESNVGHDPGSFVKVFVSVDGGAARVVRGEPTAVTGDEYDALREGATTLSEVTASAWATFEPGGGVPGRLRGKWVSCNYLTAHVPSVRAGRTLTAADCASAGTPVAVVSAHTWATTFGSDPALVGRTLALNGHPVRVVGVVADTPVRDAVAAQVFVPYTSRATLEAADSLVQGRAGRQAWLSVSGRLAPGATRVIAATELQHLIDAVNGPHGRRSLVMVTDGAAVHDPAAYRYLPAVMALGATAIGLVLLLAAANAAMLLLARVVARERDVAMRYQLGAPAGRVVQHVLVESVMVTLPAVLIGAAAAYGIPDLVAPRLGGFPLAVSLTPDLGVLSAICGLTLLGGGGCSVLPALHTRDLMRTNGGASASPRSHAWLLAPQLAVTLTLLSTVVLLVGAQRRYLQPEAAYDLGSTVAATVRLASGESSWQARERQGRVLRELRMVPGVPLVALSSPAPFVGDARVLVEGVDRTAPVAASVRIVSSGYFALTGVALRDGRLWDDDRPAAAGGPVDVVVSEILLARLGAGRVLPQRVTLEAGRQATIVGVVADTSSVRADWPDGPLLYVPIGAVRTPDVTVLARVDAASTADVAAVVGRVWPDRPVSIGTVAATLARTGSSLATATDLMAAVATLALALACVGVFGAVAFLTARRRAEIAVRLALGATSTQVAGACLGHVAAPVLSGLAVGAVLSALAAIVLHRATTIGHAIDATALTLSLIVVMTASGLAALVPALRAARSPVWAALRSE